MTLEEIARMLAGATMSLIIVGWLMILAIAVLSVF
jgi:hypothetical protein